MGLSEDLSARRVTAKERFSPEDLVVMRRATEDLRNSGILQRSLKANDAAPEWSLPSPGGDAIHSQSLLAKGPLVLTFFRGIW